MLMSSDVPIESKLFAATTLKGKVRSHRIQIYHRFDISEEERCSVVYERNFQLIR